jgi:hypothetical protein
VNLDESMFDPAMIARSRRKVRALSFDERVAIRLMWHEGKGVPGPVLARAFRCSKNTIYYRSLTGRADSYPTTGTDVDQVEAEIARLGIEEASRLYITEEIQAKVKAELARTARRKQRRIPR